VVDRCGGVSCPSGQVCNPTTGRCGANPCDLISCVRGEVCSPEQVACIPDPCIGTTCRAPDVCVASRGLPECVDPKTLTSSQAIKVSFGGCGCRVGDRDQPRALWLLALAVLLVRRRVRR
jgi:MYXO-CTERM domain-containing protein